MKLEKSVKTSDKLLKHVPPELIVCKIGEKLELEVELTRLGDFDVIWERNGELIEQGSDVEFSRSEFLHKLVIEEIQPNHLGVYEGFLENENGEEEIFQCIVSIVEDTQESLNSSNEVQKMASKDGATKVNGPR